MSDLNKQNPTLETQNKSVGIQDNSMKPVSNKSDKTYFHKKSSNPDSHSVIVKPNKSAEMIPTGRKDADGNPTFRRGKYDYRFGMYTEFDAEGNPIHPDNMDWKDNEEIKGVHIRYDDPVCDDDDNPYVDEKGRQYMFWAY